MTVRRLDGWLSQYGLFEMEQVLDYIKESYNELVNKVTWPSWSSLLSNTRLVLVASMIIALIIFLMDAVSSFILTDTIYELSR